MNMEQVLAQSEEVRSLVEEQNKSEAQKDFVKKTDRVIDGVANRAMYLVENGRFTPPWMKKEAAQLDEDIHTFIREGDGKSLVEHIVNGCGAFFTGRNSPDAIAIRKFGTYILSLEKGLEGEKYPVKVVINVQAHNRLAAMLANRMKIETPYLLGVNEIMEFEKFGKLSIEFVPNGMIPKKADVAILGKTMIPFGDKKKEVLALGYPAGDNKIYVTRTDWVSEKNVPKNQNFDFLLRYVSPPQVSE